MAVIDAERFPPLQAEDKERVKEGTVVEVWFVHTAGDEAEVTYRRAVVIYSGDRTQINLLVEEMGPFHGNLDDLISQQRIRILHPSLWEALDKLNM